ncbi:hypothetical protein KUA08_01295 [Komagataeibacter melomenusus]|nr:hypothetical protein [Komagataeibacter melomenusus]MBV1829261.1 hypothetical protein [Komagataeibacter melomenusus]
MYDNINEYVSFEPAWEKSAFPKRGTRMWCDSGVGLYRGAAYGQVGMRRGWRGIMKIFYGYNAGYGDKSGMLKSMYFSIL